MKADRRYRLTMPRKATFNFIDKALKDSKVVECDNFTVDKKIFWKRIVAAKMENNTLWVQEYRGLGGWFSPKFVRVK